MTVASMGAGAASAGGQGGNDWYRGQPSAGARTDNTTAGRSGGASPGLLSMLTKGSGPCNLTL